MTTSSAAYGGSGGSSFSEMAPEGENIRGFLLRSNGNGGKFLEFIQPIYSNGNNGFGHGGSSGSVKTWKLKENEELKEIHICHGTYVHSIQFVTNTGKSHFFGGSGGTLQIIDLAKDRLTLIGISGRSGSWMDQLSFTFSQEYFASIEKDVLLSMQTEMKSLLKFSTSFHSDFKVVVNDQPYHLHKLILTQNPTLFNLLEKNVEYKVKSLIAFDLYLGYLYTGSLEIGDQTFLDLLHFCDVVQDKNIKSRCFDYLIKTQCNVSNVFHLLNDAKNGVYGENGLELVSKCNTIINEDADICLKSEEFVNLSKDLVLQVLASDIAVGEEDVIEAAERWCKAYIKKNGGELNEIMKDFVPCIRLPLLEEDYLVQKVKPNKLFAFDNYLTAVEYKIAPECFEVLGKKEFQPRGVKTRFIWKPCDSGYFALSNKNLTVGKTSGTSDWTGGQVYGSVAFSKGKIYWECVIDKVNSDRSGYAVGISRNQSKTHVSSDPCCSLGGSNYGNTNGGIFSNCKDGDVVGMYLDFQSMQAKWYLNGKDTMIRFKLETGQAYYPVIHLYYVNDQCTLKFPPTSKWPK